MEVIRNAFEPEGGPSLHAVKTTFHVAEAAIREEVMKYLGNATPRSSTERPGSRLGGSLRSRPSKESTRLNVTQEKPEIIVGSPDDDEDWEDEPVSETSSPSDETKPRKLSPRKTKRRESLRRSAVSGAKTTRASEENPVIEVPAARQSVDLQRTDSQSSFGPRHRVTRLRAEDASDNRHMRSRESSPSRAIRFAPPEDPSRAGTSSHLGDHTLPPHKSHSHSGSH